MKDYPGYMDYLVRKALRDWSDPCSFGKKVTADFVADDLDDIVKAGSTDSVSFSSYIRTDMGCGVFSDYVLLAGKCFGKADISVVLVSIPDMSCAAMAKAYAKAAGRDLSDFLVLGGGHVGLRGFAKSDYHPCVSLTDALSSKMPRPRSMATVKACLDSYIADHFPGTSGDITLYGPDDYALG